MSFESASCAGGILMQFDFLTLSLDLLNCLYWFLELSGLGVFF